MKKKHIIIVTLLLTIIIGYRFYSKIQKDNWVKESPNIKYSEKREKEVWGSVLRGHNAALFYGTPLYDLAKEMACFYWFRSDSRIEKLINEIPKEYINYQDDKYGMTIGQFALGMENFKAIKLLLNKGLNPNLIAYKSNGRALIIDNGNHMYYHPVECLDNLKGMIKKGADVNLYSKNGIFGSTPLINAARCGNLKYFKIFIEAGANPHFIDKNACYFDRSALGTALAYKHINIVNYLIFEKKVDFRVFKYPMSSKFHPGEYEILHNLREMFFKLNSRDYQEKMKLVSYLKTQGLDYWKTPIAERFKNNPNYTKEYLSKY
jgi:ankyrin repeat protein